MGPLGIELGKTAIGTIAGMGISKWQDERQREQQEHLQNLQIKGQKEMGMFNQQLALDMWDKTNYDAQRRQMEKAGLNVGLMYGGGGQGGTTQTPTGNVTGGTASGGTGEIGMGIQLALQTAMQKAQIENTEADTKKKEVEASKLAGVDTEEAGARIANAAIQNEIMQWEQELKKIGANIAKETQWELIQQASHATNKLIGEAEQARNAGKISTETADSQIQQIKTRSIEQMLNISAQKAGLQKTATEIQGITANIAKTMADKELGWMKWEQTEKERWVKENVLKLQKTQTEYNTSTANQIKQWTSIITDVIGSITGAGVSGNNTAGFKY